MYLKLSASPMRQMRAVRFYDASLVSGIVLYASELDEACRMEII